MVLLHTPEKQSEFQAPDFKLLNINGNYLTRDTCMGENGLLVMFICNHCPYVLAIIERLSKTCKALDQEGIGCVAIMPNDTKNYPQDSYDNMKAFAQTYDFCFPYLYDETQDTARAYDAVCTPDFFGFEKDGLLQYRGRLDSAANKPADDKTIPELYNAMMDIKDGKMMENHQHPSMGCSIKWKNT